MSARQAELAAAARARGLPSLARMIAEFPRSELFARELPRDPRIEAPPPDDPMNVLALLVRRGCDPRLLPALDGWLADRPLERGLVAWDALAGSLFADGDPRLETLRAAAAPLADVLPAPGRLGLDLNRQGAAALVARFAGARGDALLVELMTSLADHALAALEELRRRGDPLPTRPGTLSSVSALGRTLALAHLPSLAAVYQDYLARALEHRPAARDLCETMFDAEAPERLPGDGVRAGDLPPEQMGDYAEYLTYRSYLAVSDPKQVHELLERNLAARKPQQPPPSAQLSLVRAHLHALVGKRSPVGADVVARIFEGNKTWRYAARVRAVATAHQ